MAGQMAVLLWLLMDFDWRIFPKGVLVAIVVWHRMALPLAVGGGLAWFGFVRWRAWMLRRRAASECVGPSPDLVSNGASRREFLVACAAATPCLFTIGASGVALAQLNRFRVRRLSVRIPTLPRALDGTTIAHITDMHVGPWTSGKVLRQMVNKTNGLRPDLVVLTGDLIDHDLAELPEALATVKAMEGRFGQWMVEGNHDLFDDGADFARSVKAAGISLLLDESRITEVRGYPVQMFGLRWMGESRGEDKDRDRLLGMQMRRVLRQRQAETFPILLAHHPHAFDQAVKANLPLTLSGHTHGGQMMLSRQRGVGPILFRYWSGLYERGGSRLVVSNGVGNVFPIRVNAPAEIVHITLSCA